MENDIRENTQETLYIAHVDPKGKRVQSLSEHLKNTADFAEKNCPLPELKNLARLTLLLHDAGKLNDDFQNYMRDIMENGDRAVRRQIDHSTAGGRMIEEIAKDTLIAKISSYVIYSHHGIQDMIDWESGKLLSEIRQEKKIPYEQIRDRYFELENRQQISELAHRAHEELKEIRKTVEDCLSQRESSRNQYGSREFYYGMLVRLLLSLQIDSDWTDTAAFSAGQPLPERISEEQITESWEMLIHNFENYMKKIADSGNKSVLNVQRSRISELCYEASENSAGRYRLTVPTGAGKTLSSLRFALYHAKRYKKQHIIYVSAFNSVLLQNAEEIRRAVGNPALVLEHHSDVICETAEEEERYRELTERWNSPIIATTAVQLLNTLFSGKKSSIRRMHQLCSSVIIFDEVQAIPVSCTELFHLAVNFLSEFAGSTIVLCSATQPSLAKLRENNLMPCMEMAGDPKQYAEAFQRADIIDQTALIPGGMRPEELKDFVLHVSESQDTILIIMNTRASAAAVYESLRSEAEERDWNLYHLSKNMCSAHIADELERIRRELADHRSGKSKRKMVCVSTQLIEAGVDLSFSCVIRSEAGLDSIVQAAGRCNRHKEAAKMGQVYIVRMSEDVEHVGKIYEMDRARKACDKNLDRFRENPQIYNFRLDDQRAITAYYTNFYEQLSEEDLKYPIHEPGGIDTNLVDLLGSNEAGKKRHQDYRGISSDKIGRWLPVNQAFRTAGQAFRAIQEMEQETVIVPYNPRAEHLIEELEAGRGIQEQKRIVRELQRYAVGIPLWQLESLGNAVYKIAGGAVLGLNKDYYNDKMGIQMEPEHPMLMF